MSLKNIKLSTPEYDDKIPSTGKKVKITPFRVGDEKTLLIAAQSENGRQMIAALKSVIKNCVKGIDVEELAPYDLEYLFIKLRAKSVGETATIGIACQSCEVTNELPVDLTTVQVSENKNKSNLIKIEDNLAFKMKYPEADDIVDIDLNDPASIMKVIALTVEQVYHGEEVIDIDPSDGEDLIALIESMTSAQFEKLQDFFLNMPKVYKEITFTCGSCGHENEIKLEGLASFF